MKVVFEIVLWRVQNGYYCEEVEELYSSNRPNTSQQV